jgi:four helix bundle protein
MAMPLKPARTFQDLIVWAKAHEFAHGGYKVTTSLPKRETNELCSQMRRAAVSFPANIPEGFRRHGRAEKVRFMNIAEGSLEEGQYYLILVRDLSYGSTEGPGRLLEEVSRLPHAYSKAIRTAGGRDSDCCLPTSLEDLL